MNTTQSNMSWSDITAYASKGAGCAWQESRNNQGWHTFKGNVKNTRLCGRGYDKSDLAIHLLQKPFLKSSSDELLEQCDLGMEGHTVDDNIITINNIYGYMEALDDMISSFTVRLWLPEDDSDTTVSESEYIYEGTIKVINGEVVLEGDFANGGFSSSLYTDSLVGDFRRVRFLGGDLDITVSLPAGYDMEDVAVMTEVDGRYNDEYNQKLAVGITENKVQNGELSFTAFPNPSSGIVNISYRSNLNAETSIKLYDSNGKLVQVLLSKNLRKAQEVTLELQMDLPSGLYYVVVDNYQDVFVKEVIKH